MGFDNESLMAQMQNMNMLMQSMKGNMSQE